MPYPELMVAPMRQELVDLGFAELRTAADVEKFLAQKTGTAMVVVNSVCGCAAGKCRPGVAMSLKSEPRPQRLATVFAGNDVEATQKLRETFSQVPPSSPSIFLIKNGQLHDFVPRHLIENQPAQAISEMLRKSYERMQG